MDWYLPILRVTLSAYICSPTWIRRHYYFDGFRHRLSPTISWQSEYGGSKHSPTSDSRLTCGLAAQHSVQGLRIRWRARHAQRHCRLAADRCHLVREGYDPVPDPRVHTQQPSG